jgi:hypothetical protein
MNTVDPAFRERYLRQRNTPRAAADFARKCKRAADEEKCRRRAQAVLDVSRLGGDWDAAVAASGMKAGSLGAWLHQYTGSTLWPLDDARRAKLAYLAEKYN